MRTLFTRFDSSLCEVRLMCMTDSRFNCFCIEWLNAKRHSDCQTHEQHTHRSPVRCYQRVADKRCFRLSMRAMISMVHLSALLGVFVCLFVCYYSHSVSICPHISIDCVRSFHTFFHSPPFPRCSPSSFAFVLFFLGFSLACKYLLCVYEHKQESAGVYLNIRTD